MSATSSNSSYGSVSGSGTYAQGTTVTLTATPGTNCIFDHWSDGSTEASRTVTVSKNVSYQAVFYGPESDWVSSVPEDAVQTDRRTVYTKTETVTTAGTSPGSDYVLVKDEWVKRTSGTVNYAPRLPSGIRKSGSVYEQYCQSPVRAYSNTSEKLVIDSDQRIGWLYHHYCRGTYTSGPINRQTNYVSAGEFSVYHIYFDAKEPGYYGSQYTDHCGHNPACDGSGSWGRANAGVCRDSYWYYATEINRQTYTIYDRQCTYERTTECTSDPGGDVPSRTEYRYRLK